MSAKIALLLHRYFGDFDIQRKDAIAAGPLELVRAEAIRFKAYPVQDLIRYIPIELLPAWVKR